MADGSLGHHNTPGLCLCRHGRCLRKRRHTRHTRHTRHRPQHWRHRGPLRGDHEVHLRALRHLRHLGRREKGHVRRRDGIATWYSALTALTPNARMNRCCFRRTQRHHFHRGLLLLQQQGRWTQTAHVAHGAHGASITLHTGKATQASGCKVRKTWNILLLPAQDRGCLQQGCVLLRRGHCSFGLAYRHCWPVGIQTGNSTRTQVARASAHGAQNTGR